MPRRIVVISEEAEAERFWGKVEKTAGCWLWTEGTNGRGYGRFYATSLRRQVPAHRFAFKLQFGSIPRGLVVCHACDVPLCVNPSHLFLGTQAENMADAVNKGRMRPGIVKLSPADIPCIRWRLAAGELQQAIAADYGVSSPAISRIATGSTWRRV